MRWINSRYADFIPLLAFAVVMGGVFLVDRARLDRLESLEREAESRAERQAGLVADEIGNVLSERLGAVAGLELQFGAPDDTMREQAFMAAFDSVTGRFAGLMAISAVHPATEEVRRGSGAVLGRLGFDVTRDSVVRNAYLRSLHMRAPAATGMLELEPGRPRVIVFDPVTRGDDESVDAVLAAELDPPIIVRSALQRGGVIDSIRGTFHTVYGPNAVRITTPAGAPAAWPRTERRTRLADTEWVVEITYPPIDMTAFHAERLALWVSGLAIAAMLGLILLVLRRTVASQRDELKRRRAAEEAARQAAEEARRRAREARDLAAQLEAAQRAAQQLSTSLNPDNVVDLFLGAVAEILDADVASLYTFEDEGEVLVGRRRVVFRDVGPATERLQREDIRQVRAPVALLPVLAEAVATGEPYVIEDAGAAGRTLGGLSAGPEAAAASITVPLLIAGHTVGVASWEVYGEPRSFPSALVAFAQALAAPASAALRTAELFASLEAERARAEREALRFAAVLDQMADGVVVVNAEGHVERSNKAAGELLGEELQATPVEQWTENFELVSVEGRPLGSDDLPLSRAMRGERVRRATFIVRSPWGTERHLSASAGPILTPDGEASGAAMVLRDVSDEHQYAEMLRHTNRELRRQAEVLEEVNQQLRDATKAKDQFLAVMSHELRTPINAIMGYSDLLDLGIKGELNDSQRNMVSRVRETSRHLLGLINEVLDLAKIGAGRIDLVLVDVDVGTIIDRAVQQITPIAAGKGLELAVVPRHGSRPVRVLADETRLTQIVINLLSNAVKFTPAGGVTVSYEDLGDSVEIRVRDTGPGIPADQQDRVFEEFYQVEGGLARSSGGTGLGLAIARRFARLMGGDIRVESEAGAGSEFIIEMQSSRAAETESPASAHGVVMLTHSDDALKRTRQDLAGILDVDGATDPTSFSVAARRPGVRLAAIDAAALDFAAWRALQALLTEAATTELPVLLYVHADEAGDTAYPIGCFRLIPKPLALEEATRAVLAAGDGDGLRVLVHGSDADVRSILADALIAKGCVVEETGDGREAGAALERDTPDVLVVDLLGDGDMSGFELMARCHAAPHCCDVPVVALLQRELAEPDMLALEKLTDMIPITAATPRATATVLREAVDQAGGPAFAGAES